MKYWKQPVASLLAVLFLCVSIPWASAAQDPDSLTRGQTADILLQAAEDYHPGVQRSDILKGYPNGDLDENGAVNRVQALVMLQRAFGGLPTPVGDNARSGYPATTFSDVPAWAQEELSGVFASGIVAGTSPTTFSPNLPITRAHLQLFLQRTYALEGSNLKDDFYATVNKTALDNSVILPGYTGTSSFIDLSVTANQNVSALIQATAANPQTLAEQQISNLYHNILNISARNAAGITPLQPYLDQINQASTIDELMAACDQVYQDLGLNLLLGFSLTVNPKDSTSYMLTIGSITPTLGQSGYASATSDQQAAYRTYVETLCQLLGRTDAQARLDADNIWALESTVAEASLSTQDRIDVDKTYNVFTLAQLQTWFPQVDLTALFSASGLSQTDQILIPDVGAVGTAAAYFNDKDLDLLQSYCRLGLAMGYGVALNEEFQTAQETFQAAYYGIEGTLSLEDTAAQYVQNLLSDNLGQAYVDRYFSAQAKANVEQMVRDILSVYRDRIEALTWMSDTTKAKAVRKLDTMELQIGYPDTWDDTLANAQILSANQGGTFINNLISIQKTYLARLPQLQQEGVDKDSWVMTPYTINACYDPLKNTIEFPAGILQAPFYDINASYEKNLGSIGYIIAHEISHAFDNNGAKYDENGNATDWWTPADYSALQALCQKTVQLYQGRESAPAVTCNGSLTLSENIADLGSAACITQLESRQSTPDYAALYTAMGQIWYSSYPREMKQYLSQADIHAPDKLRGSLVLQNFQEFYDAFGIQEGDGMWLAPEDRVTIW